MNNILWLVLYPCIKYVFVSGKWYQIYVGIFDPAFFGFFGVICFGYWGNVFVKQVIFIPGRDGPGWGFGLAGWYVPPEIFTWADSELKDWESDKILAYNIRQISEQSW